MNMKGTYTTGRFLPALARMVRIIWPAEAGLRALMGNPNEIRYPSGVIRYGI
ncbi:MAG: hypothetical protein ACYS76_12845 [Planctomycetota bacterium]